MVVECSNCGLTYHTIQNELEVGDPCPNCKCLYGVDYKLKEVLDPNEDLCDE